LVGTYHRKREAAALIAGSLLLKNGCGRFAAGLEAVQRAPIGDVLDAVVRPRR
jgi:hypothetical protein